jgi:dTDP-4-dehydrorhamnose 3,5-epimerase
MPIIKTPIKDLLIFEPRVFSDERGYFFESYNQNVFKEAGIDITFVQDNQSFSSYGTIRGLHFQEGEHAQAKLVRVTQGKVLDVAVDLRPDSETFGQSYSIELSAENNKQFLVPRGFAHGFSVLSETAIFQYKVDNFYNQASENGIIYNDSDLNIDWQIPDESIGVSSKDATLGTFKEYKELM